MLIITTVRYDLEYVPLEGIPLVQKKYAYWSVFDSSRLVSLSI